MRIPLFFHDALEDKEHIALLSKENPNIVFQKTHSLGYKIILQYHNFREKYLLKHNQSPSPLAIKWFNFQFYMKYVFLKKFINASILILLYLVGIAGVLFIYHKLAQLFGLL